jgi:phage N-6-adenine-methyltransferase
MNAVHYSSKKDEWETPPEIFDPIDAEFDFDIDVCASEQNTKCQVCYTEQLDGLKRDWHILYNASWCNPPYSNLKAWIAKNANEAKQGMTCVMLIPSRTDTKAWHAHIYDAKLWRFRPGVEVRFLKGRIKFLEDGKPVISKRTGKPQGAPFPSCVVIFRPT